ncbi:hypothetical protein A5789_05845 [Nocardia sp. 852002-51101_SCH5132738]|nr:hypothetical protein A5789_05845 [Nocardia sp. 852002-51101_SCH5132738]OBB38591.1 hypothetical protein A5748_02750 [Nocardia sp. 852002-51244_SCH5132740]OBF82933.1 hypothetical protein A9X06_18375 [Mycobacterium sp. 852002-51759_SCH5129042]
MQDRGLREVQVLVGKEVGDQCLKITQRSKQVLVQLTILADQDTGSIYPALLQVFGRLLPHGDGGVGHAKRVRFGHPSPICKPLG